MTAPDYVFPVIGYRVWQWDATGLKSLNGINWHPGEAFTAECRTQGCHEVPRPDCTCGVYGSKSLDHLRQLGYMQHRIYGEVCLWGTIVEHEGGWRAQFAYPQNFIVPLSLVPLGMSRAEEWLAALSGYGCNIFLDGDEGTVPLWCRESGVDASGIDLLVRRSDEWYARRAEEQQIKRGDQIAVLGHGIAVVEHANADEVLAVLGKRNVLRIERYEVVWCEQYERWEAAAGASIRLSARKEPQPPA